MLESLSCPVSCLKQSQEQTLRRVLKRKCKVCTDFPWLYLLCVEFLEVSEVKKLHPADEPSHEHIDLLEQICWYLLS